MSTPEFLVCLNCESPCYIFEWKDGEIQEALCDVCGNDDLDEFLPPTELEELTES